MTTRPKRKRPDVPFDPPDWPATAPEIRAIDKIIPYPDNPRRHPETQIKILAGMMQRYGVDQPIVVDEDGVILKGHGRRLAAIEAGFKEFPVVVHHGLSDTVKRAMRIEDNQVSLLAGWDRQLLQSETVSLKAAGYDTKLLGFGDAQLVKFETPDVEAPVSPTKPTSRRGDLWRMGDHAVLCDDATAAESWDRLFRLPGPKRASMVFTDPPYGVSYEAKSGKFDVIIGDKKRHDDLYKMLVGSLRQMVKAASHEAAFYIWHASSTRQDFSEAMKAAGLQESQYLIWVKPSIALGHSDYGWQHEPCFYASKAGQSPAFYGDRAQSTVWHVSLAKMKEVAVSVANGLLLLDGAGHSIYVQNKQPKGKKLRSIRITDDQQVYLLGGDSVQGTVWEVSRDPGGYDHPTQKPLELARRAIENSSRPGEIVIDGFCGSGTTILACEATGRIGRGTELDPKYCDVIVRRWQTLTGQAAVHAESGRTFDDSAKAGGKGRAPGKTAPAATPARRTARGAGKPTGAPKGKGRGQAPAQTEPATDAG